MLDEKSLQIKLLILWVLILAVNIMERNRGKLIGVFSIIYHAAKIISLCIKEKKEGRKYNDKENS